MNTKLLRKIKFISSSVLLTVLFVFLLNCYYVGINAQDNIKVSLTTPQTNLENAPSFSGDSARGSCLIDAKSGSILYEKNQNTRMPMASTTKIMTALCAIENMDVNRVVTVPKQAIGVEGSSLYLKENEQIKVIDLLYGLMLESGNDAATAVAVLCSGSVEEFVKLMNQKAKETGLIDTHFDNPHGLHSENHYTTPYELALLCSKALENEIFAKIVSSKNHYANTSVGRRYFVNHNKLLRYMENAAGVKTGFTKTAGRCLVSASKINNSTFVAVTLNDSNDWNDHMNMHSYAANNFETVEIADKNDFVIVYDCQKYVPLQSAYLTVVKGHKPDIDYQLKFDKNETFIEYKADGNIMGKIYMALQK